MKRKAISLMTAALVCASAWTAPVQAASFAAVQPYLTDYKIGFTDGNKLVTKAEYDAFDYSAQAVIVTKAGKKGLLDVRTGQEITSAVWDEIEIPGSKQIAIVRKGGWFQYIDLTTKKLSATKFAGAHSYYLSPDYDPVIVMSGQTSMLLDSTGKVLIPPFAGKLSIVPLIPSEAKGDQEAKETRYVVATTAKAMTVYDPATFTPRFSLPGATLIPNEGGPKTAYFKVRLGGKEGLVDVNGQYVLPAQFKAIYTWNQGYFQLAGANGVGLWKDGQLLAEPLYAEVGFEHNNPDLYWTLSKDVMIYHSIAKGTSHALKKGADYLHDSYVLGQDPHTGLYGVVQVGKGVVIPFEYPRVEGTPFSRLLVRSDGKKTILPAWGKAIIEPDFWFDSLTPLGSDSMQSVKDGSKIGLYSEREGLLLAPVENRVIRYEEASGQVVVTEPGGSVLRFGGISGKKESDHNVRPLSEKLNAVNEVGKGSVLVDRSTDKPISKRYAYVYVEDASKLIVAVDGQTADLYTPEGMLLTTDVKLARWQERSDAPPVTIMQVGEAFYTLGAKEGTNKRAFIRIADGQLQAASEFAYREAVEIAVGEQKAVVAMRADGTFDVWAREGSRLVQKLANVTGYETASDFDKLLVQTKDGWDVYSSSLERITTGNYPSLKPLPQRDERPDVVVYQDKQTGLYGLLAADGRQLTAPKYEVIKPSREVFPGLWQHDDTQPPFAFAIKDQFGYLDPEGKELFTTKFLTKKPVITHRPLQLQSFEAYTTLMKQNPLELVDFGKPYSWSGMGSSESKFYANLALYLGLPQGAGKAEVFAALAAKGAIKPDEKRADMSDEDMYRLAYFMATGKTSQAMTAGELTEWARKRGIVPERGGISYYMTMDLYAEYHQMFFAELLRSQAGKKIAKPKVLKAGELSPAQKEMVETMLLVNGKQANQLPLPLPQAEWNRGVQQFLTAYQKQAAGLLAAYVQQAGK
ncbi:WG repeat-containing protein [Brevibacillus gelatini]|uniref:WG repeat-containing protein n=1 Tax=Brevibacillus gelatini TaxID=1655277 RepID=A0A3M8BCI0_9BACL|nr:WG repeat-containing protein [Brevibacillus gelatini]RNB61106.1 WG repeat-containing protein [Brevibacillus gelatini]